MKNLKVYAFDFEANELLPKVTRIHSLVIRDAWTGELLFSGSSDSDPTRPDYRDGYAILNEADICIGHNAIGYDFPLAEKIDGWITKKEARWDTMILAASRVTDQQDKDYAIFRKGKLPGEMIGRQSLEAWGYRLGCRKIQYEGGWDEWSEEMQVYCEGDVEVLCHIWRYMYSLGFKEETMRVEMRLAEYLFHQERNGFPFDVDKAQALSVQLELDLVPLKKVLREFFGNLVIKPQRKVLYPKKTQVRMGKQFVKGCGYCRLSIEEFNPGSDMQVVDALKRKYDWKPTVFTEKGNVQFDEPVIKSLEYPEREPLLKWAKVKKIQSMLEGGAKAWLKKVTDEGRIHHRCNQSGTVTHRAAHSNPNLGQTPSTDKPYGLECRSLFGPPKGWTQVGIDVSGLENVMLAHYAHKFDSGEFTKYVLEGDTHTAGMIAGGFTTERPIFKTWWYAYLYGAGNEKLGKIIGKDIDGGKASRAKFQAGMKGIGLLVDDIQEVAEKGWFRLLDGRVVPCRSTHSALNTLLQGSGSVLVKFWIVYLYEELLEKFGQPGWDGRWSPLAWVHDEVQIASRDQEVTDFLMTRGVELIAKAGERFNLRCPITGEAKSGSSWADCH